MKANEAYMFDQGVMSVLMLVRYTASRLRAEQGWRPAREGAADALDELAVAGETLLIGSASGAAEKVLPNG